MSSTGFVRALQAGVVLVVATVGSVSDRVDLTVVPAVAAVASVQLAPASANVAVGQTVTLAASPRDASGAPLTGRNIAWSSNENVIATVSQSGLVSGQSPGTAIITAESEGQRGTATVVVSPAAVAAVTLSSGNLSVSQGEVRSIAATARDASGAVLPGRAASWSSSSPGVATVTSTGTATASITAVGTGTTTISATIEGRSASIQFSVGVAGPAPVASVTVSPTSTTIAVGATASLSAVTRDASGNLLTGRAVTWSSTASAIASVSPAGVVSGVSQGTATITATSEGRIGTATVTVTQGTGGGEAQARFANEPSGMTLVTDWSFPTLVGSGWTYSAHSAYARIAQDATAPTDPSVLEFVYPRGFTGGGGPARVTAPDLGSDRREVYWAFTFKANAGWQNHSSGINKIGYGWHNGARTFGLTWYWFNDSGTKGISFFDSGITYFHQNTSQAVNVLPGQWYEVEVQYRPSSAAGRADGIVRIWINGVLSNNYVNVVTTPGTLYDIYFDPTWGGLGDTKGAEDSFRFGQVRISVR